MYSAIALEPMPYLGNISKAINMCIISWDIFFFLVNSRCSFLGDNLLSQSIGKKVVEGAVVYLLLLQFYVGFTDPWTHSVKLTFTRPLCQVID